MGLVWFDPRKKKKKRDYGLHSNRVPTGVFYIMTIRHPPLTIVLEGAALAGEL